MLCDSSKILIFNFNALGIHSVMDLSNFQNIYISKDKFGQDEILGDFYKSIIVEDVDDCKVFDPEAYQIFHFPVEVDWDIIDENEHEIVVRIFKAISLFICDKERVLSLDDKFVGDLYNNLEG
jgi:hypothetical protein